VYLATGQGLGVLEGATLSWQKAADGRLPDDDVLSVSADAGKVVAGCSTGIATVGGASVKAEKGGLPAGDVIALAAGGAILGHARGATVRTGERRDHYVGLRWVPDDRVQAVAMGVDAPAPDEGPSIWLGTPEGVSRIRLRDTTLAAKAESVFQKLPHFWRMDGFVAPDARVDDGRNPSKWDPLWDSDNDGLWTQMAIGAFCYAYAVTKDEPHYAAARKAMDTMFLEIDVPAADFRKAGLGRGFVTRSLIRDDEGALFDSHATETRWHLVEHTDGHAYYWKDDTSSDETTGHFFGYPLFFDLCAKDDAERAAVAEHAGALASYIVEGGYTLRDLDGQPTSFGHWEPSIIAIAVDGLPACAEAGNSIEDCAYAAFGGGWLNGIEILGHMLAAWHMTGDPKFKAAYEELCTTHRYCEAVRFHDQIATVVSPRIANHSDHELAMLAYHTLIRYEPDDARRAMWVADLLAFWAWESGGVAKAGDERQPLWAAFVALAAGGEGRADAFADAAQSLREYPGDLVLFRFDNTHRKDAGDWPNDRFDDPQFDTVFPYDEIAQMWWNGNPYNKVDGGDGRSLQGPMAFLLAYWAQRYAGMLQ
ncbi:MAG: hypothetical protein FJ087_19670, partial [Deltaproteobacteria bacterium]|nr:hypothetical protein [Deltaproteobacteria bacterium]